MSIEIIKPGLLSTLVGGERIGFRNIGVGPGGAMDRFAVRVSNYLVGNEDGMAVMEMHFPAPEILVKQSHAIAVTGTGFEMFINEVEAPLWKPIIAPENSIIKFKSKLAGRGYLSVCGGWKAQEWLGSFSTHSGIHAGGHFGRAIRKGDQVEADGATLIARENGNLPWGISKNELDKIYFPPKEIRCIASAETILLSKKSSELFASQFFTIAQQSNRMGYRLKGEPLALEEQMELVSSPVDFGTVQLLPDGNLVILMADHQTTGGYPRIASVIKADLPKLAQLGSTMKINFKMISLMEAEELLFSMENLLGEIKMSCRRQISKYIAK